MSLTLYCNKLVGGAVGEYWWSISESGWWVLVEVVGKVSVGISEASVGISGCWWAVSGSLVEDWWKVGGWFVLSGLTTSLTNPSTTRVQF